MNSKFIRALPCPSCREKGLDNTGNNLAIYSDGHGYCYSCKKYFPSPPLTKDSSYDTLSLKSLLGDTYDLTLYATNIRDTKIGTTNNVVTYETLKDPMNSLETFTYQYVGSRGISRDTMEYYGVQTKVNSLGEPKAIAFPYGTYTVARSLPDKNFTTLGDGSGPLLFGQEKFNVGCSNYITLTEGAYDAMSIYECLGRKYPSVSVRSASTARSDCERSYHYLNAFERIYICFDNDVPGARAASDVASLFDVNKVYHVKLDRWKDANAALQEDPDSLRRVWYNAKKYQPKGLRDAFDDADTILSQQENQARGSYPFPTLQEMAYGVRWGELVLFTALEKVGKTEVLRAIEHHLLKTTEDNIGIIHLEEQDKRSVQGLIGYELGAPVHLPDSGVSLADQQQAVKSLVKKAGRLTIHSHFGSDDPDDILQLIRYMAAVNKCKFIFLDHITMLVTGFEGDDERKKLDYLSTRLAMLTRELNFTLFLVSHVNDQGQTRGSRNIAKVADLIIHLDRDIESPDEGRRNTTRLTCRGNRYAGITGPAGSLLFDARSFTVKELADEVLEVS